MKKLLISSIITVGAVAVSAMEPVCAGQGLSYASQRIFCNKYVNSRFGFSINVPCGFVANPPPANGDGRSFYDKYGARFIVWGRTNVLNDTVMSAYRESLNEHPNAAYHTHGKTWYVISYREKDFIVYEKYFINADYVNGWIFKYPASRANIMNPICSAVAKTFVPGWTNPNRED